MQLPERRVDVSGSFIVIHNKRYKILLSKQKILMNSDPPLQHCLGSKIHPLDCVIYFYSFSAATVRLYPPTNVTAINITSSSVVLQWKPYAGDASLMGYNLLVLEQGSKDQNLTQLKGDSFNVNVCANVTLLKIGNLSSFTRYCVQIRVITKMRNGDLSECYFFYTKGVKVKGIVVT